MIVQKRGVIPVRYVLLCSYRIYQGMGTIWILDNCANMLLAAIKTWETSGIKPSMCEWDFGGE